MAVTFTYEGDISLADIPYNIIDATNNKRGSALLIFESARGFRLCEKISSEDFIYFADINTAEGSGVKTVDNIGTITSGTDGTYTIGTTDYTTQHDGADATFSVVISGSGTAAAVTITSPGKDFIVNETITIPAANVGNTNTDLTFDVASTNGVAGAIVGTAYVDNNTLTRLSGTLPVGSNIIKVGNTLHKVTSTLGPDVMVIDNAPRNIITTQITAANPSVITTSEEHGLSANDPIRFKAVYSEEKTAFPPGDGTANSGIFPDTTYYVDSSNLTTTSFQLLDSVGGSSISVSEFINTNLSIMPIKEIKQLVFDATPESSTILAKVTKKFDGTNTTYEMEPFVVQKVINNRIDASITTTSTLVAADANTIVTATGGITIPASVFQPRDSLVILGGGTQRVITRGSGLNMYFAGTDEPSVNLDANGMMSVVFETATKCIVSGDIST